MKDHCKEGECPRIERVDEKIKGEEKANKIFRRLLYVGISLLIMTAGYNTWIQKDMPVELATIKLQQDKCKKAHEKLIDILEDRLDIHGIAKYSKEENKWYY
ncbi:unnamed protein product [marine sediment metagenome]|uniref:Uncharacterized protein n=1 Tax=marine sediment metagenome TaxID=412755 RepID=X1E0M6_9ZZZZ